jgi:hypothetical protein
MDYEFNLNWKITITGAINREHALDAAANYFHCYCKQVGMLELFDTNEHADVKEKAISWSVPTEGGGFECGKNVGKGYPPEGPTDRQSIGGRSITLVDKPNTAVGFTPDLKVVCRHIVAETSDGYQRDVDGNWFKDCAQVKCHSNFEHELERMYSEKKAKKSSEEPDKFVTPFRDPDHNQKGRV